MGEALKRSGNVLATAESCTAGGIAEAVTTVAGSSDWFDRGYVTYSNDAKRDMLGVSLDTLETAGAVSEAVVEQMARGALKGGATVAVAVSGIAGPGGATASKPVGMVCIGWAHKNGALRKLTRHYAGDRAAVRGQTIVDALEGLIDFIGGAGRAP